MFLNLDDSYVQILRRIVYTHCDVECNPVSFTPAVKDSQESLYFHNFSCVCMQEQQQYSNYAIQAADDWETERRFFYDIPENKIFCGTGEESGAGCSALVRILEEFYSRCTLEHVYPAVVCRLLQAHDHIEDSGRMGSDAATALQQTLQACLQGLNRHCRLLTKRTHTAQERNVGKDDLNKVIYELTLSRENLSVALKHIAEQCTLFCTRPASNSCVPFHSWNMLLERARLVHERGGSPNNQQGEVYKFQVIIPLRYIQTNIKDVQFPISGTASLSTSRSHPKIIPVTCRSVMEREGKNEYRYECEFEIPTIYRNAKDNIICTIAVLFVGIPIASTPITFTLKRRTNSTRLEDSVGCSIS